MGLHKQHAAQQMCLARTRDFVVAACVAKAAARLLGHGAVATRVEASDERAFRMQGAWAGVCSEVGLV